MIRACLWSISVALIWPVVQIMIYTVRFGSPSLEVLSSSVIFLPMGFVSAIILICLLDRSGTRSQKASTIFGYLLASPFALIGGLLSGLMFPPLVGTLIFGTIPLTIGTVIGYLISGLMNYPGHQVMVE